MSGPKVASVSLARGHGFSKRAVLEVRLVAGLGVEGDAHFGSLTQHRYYKRFDPQRPNLRQVHLIEERVYQDLQGLGFAVEMGDLGENITTSGTDLTSLPEGTLIQIGEDAQIELTGLREPCVLIDRFMPDLRKAVSVTGEDGRPFVRGAVMARVVRSGVISAGDMITSNLPRGLNRSLQNV